MVKSDADRDRTAVLINGFNELHRALDAAEKEFAQRTREARNAANLMIESSLGASAKPLSLAEKMDMATEHYYTKAPGAPVGPVIRALGFTPPTGFASHGFPFLVLSTNCRKCGAMLLKESPRSFRTLCRGLCDEPDKGSGLEERIKSRGLVMIDEAGKLVWLQRGE